ncbi:MAG: glycosyltransferase [Lachnospiraceae bacterium]|nr:glycosyltransferase [Lachnospiraceae bacterium]
MTDTSMIVTLYQGDRYLPYLLQIAEENFRNMKLRLGLDCELILVNDDPRKILPIKGGEKSWGEIIVRNLEENRGIHGARQSGVKLAKGRYLVFLDQDDKISGSYLASQREKIGDNDAVVCNGYLTKYCMDVKWCIYASPEAQEQVSDLDKYLSQGNQIISPGQVLLKREAIPEIWMGSTMKRNGADDYLLWVLMLVSGKLFSVNAECIYVHVGHGGNISNQTAAMDVSIKEAIGIIRESVGGLDIQEEQLDKMEQWRKEKWEREKSAKTTHIFEIFGRWTYLGEQGISMADFFQSQGAGRLAIYGLGYIGGRLFDELRDTGVEVVCGIDRQADRVAVENLPVVALDDEKTEEFVQRTDAIVVTAIYDVPQIKKMIEARFQDIRIFSFEEIIQELLASSG